MIPTLSAVTLFPIGADLTYPTQATDGKSVFKYLSMPANKPDTTTTPVSKAVARLITPRTPIASRYGLSTTELNKISDTLGSAGTRKM